MQSQHIYQESTIVRFPKEKCNYHILSKNQEFPETIVTFSGNQLESCAYFDLASGFAQYTDDYLQGTGRYSQINFDKIKFVSKESLPPNKVREFLPAVLIMDNEKDWIKTVISMKIHFHLPSAYVNYEWEYYMHLPAYQYIAINANPSIELGKFPLFMTNCPSAEKIADIHQQFIKYNPTHKLLDQYIKSYNLCQIRAHFVYALLHSYGIQTFKIFKLWNPYKVKYRYRFHAAALIIDNVNMAWVWDPWGDEIAGTRSFLMPVKKWLSEKHEPEPTSVIITNGAVVNDYPHYQDINGTNFMEAVSWLGKKTLQTMFSLAVPNPPEKPISLGNNIFSLFMGKQKNKKNNKRKNPYGYENVLSMSIARKVCKY